MHPSLNPIKIIGICGGSGSGKTTLGLLLSEQLGQGQAQVLYQDNYYIDQSHRFDGDGGSVNFDHPDSLDFPLLSQHLQELKSGRSIDVPHYDFATHKRLSKVTPLPPTPFIILDGTLILSQVSIRPHLDISIFLDISEPLRFSRRLKRDTTERGRTPEGVQKQFTLQVQPMHELFVQTSAQFAHYVFSSNDEASTFAQQLAERLRPKDMSSQKTGI